VLAAAATRQLARRAWSAIAGATGAAAIIALTLAFPIDADLSVWMLLVAPAAAIAALNLLGTVLPLPRTASRGFVTGGALGVAAVAAVPPLAASLGTGASALLAEATVSLVTPQAVTSVILGLAAIAAGLGCHAALSARRWPGELAAWFATASALTLVSHPAVALPARLAIGLALAVAASVALAAVPRLRGAVAGYRLPLIVGAHLAVLLCAVMSWRDSGLVVWTGAAVVVAIAAVARGIPAGARFVHVAAGYAYALVVFATALRLEGVDTVPTLCLTTSLGALGAIAATFLRRVGPRSWWAVLAVTAVPFGLGVLQVVFERSGWTALSTGLIFLLALTLTVTRREGLGAPLRALAAGLLVPSLSVVVVCLGAQLLVDSGSPVVLPVIATIVALVLPATGLVRTGLAHRGVTEADAATVRVAIEASALLTGAIAVLLGLVREAAGLGTTLLVLVILGAGAAATARWGERRYGWWVAAASFTGALWCAWGMAGVDVLEPYLLPPAIAAAVVGAILAVRGRRGLPLYATGLVVAVTPVLLLLAAADAPATAMPAWRAYGLLAASWALLGLGGLIGRAGDRAVRELGVPTLAVAIGAGAAGAVEGARLGVGLDAASGPMPLVVLCTAISFLGAVPAFAAARLLHRRAAEGSRLARTPWPHAPAALYLAAGTWTAIHRDWFTIWWMWALMLAYLVAMTVVAARLRSPSPALGSPSPAPRSPSPSRGLPPVWLLFAIAFATAVVAWSPRDLRVEWFSLPLGAFLLAAGALHVRRTGDGGSPHPATLASWPAGWTGSWPLLLPGLVVLLSASMTATFTDPLTWRAILVIVLALVAILVGATLRLAAPFLVGIVVLPVENALAFLVQIGRGIESMPWWITLAVVGAVLLIIAVTYERRASSRRAGLRLRDLS